MKLIVFVCILLISPYSHCRNNNSNVTLEILCIENENFEQLHQHDCDLTIKLCLHTRDMNSNNQVCDIYSQNFKVKNAAGMCKRGIHDTRGVLNKPQQFLTNWSPFNAHFYIETRKEDNTIEYNERLKARIVPAFNYSEYSLESLETMTKKTLKIKMQLKFECARNFYGNNCQVFCVDVPSHFRCNSDGSRNCVNGYQGPNCNVAKECGINAQCKCVNISKETYECTEMSIICPTTPIGCESKKCTFNMIDLNESCIEKSTNGTVTNNSSSLNAMIVESAAAVGGIIVIIILILFFLAMFNGTLLPCRRRSPTDSISLNQRSNLRLPDKPMDPSVSGVYDHLILNNHLPNANPVPLINSNDESNSIDYPGYLLPQKVCD